MLPFLQIIHFLAKYHFLCSPKVQKLDLQRYTSSVSLEGCTFHEIIVYILDIEVLEDVKDESEVKAEEFQILE